MNKNVITYYMLYVVPKFNQNSLIPTTKQTTTTRKRTKITVRTL